MSQNKNQNTTTTTTTTILSSLKDECLHVAMYPWLAMGHITQFLDLANKLAKRGIQISLIVPTGTIPRLTSQNHHPNLITFIPITVPHVDGLPLGAETTNDIPNSAVTKLVLAMDLTQDLIDAHLSSLKPHVVFFDMAGWIPRLARKHGAKSLSFAGFHSAVLAYCSLFARGLPLNHHLVPADLMEPPPGFPSSNVKLYDHEARALVDVFTLQVGNGLTFLQKNLKGVQESDGLFFKACREIEGGYCDFVEKHDGKPVLLAGPSIPEPPSSKLDEFFDTWLSGFGCGSVVYCALGSECALPKEQFQELVLGLELTGRPFFAALQPPTGCDSIQSCLPDGFEERTKEQGIVYGGWVQQQLILQHKSVGCFVTHCGRGSLNEGLISGCQLVLMPRAVDQFLNARVMSMELKVGVEVEKRGNDGFVGKEAIREAVTTVMEAESQVGREVKANHAKWREILLTDGLEDSYITSFIQQLRDLFKN